MKNVHLSYLYLFFAINSFIFISNCKVNNEIISIEKEEIIGNKIFIDKQKIQKGKEEHDFLVDGNTVTKDSFLKEKREAQINELEQLNKKEEEKIESERKFKHNSKISILKKLLKINLNDLEIFLDKLKKNDLERFYSYSIQTFDSLNNLENLTNDFIPELKFSLNKTNDQLTIDYLNQMLEKIESYLNKINEFYRNTINNAIELCDDTKLLKDLLELF